MPEQYRNSACCCSTARRRSDSGLPASWTWSILPMARSTCSAPILLRPSPHGPAASCWRQYWRRRHDLLVGMAVEVTRHAQTSRPRPSRSCTRHLRSDLFFDELVRLIWGAGGIESAFARPGSIHSSSHFAGGRLFGLQAGLIIVVSLSVAGFLYFTGHAAPSSRHVDSRRGVEP